MTDLLTHFAVGIPLAQEQLDHEWRRARCCFRRSLPPDVREWVSLASGVSPARQVVLEAEMSAAISFDRERSTEWKVSVLNLGFERKFVHSDFVRHSVAVKVVAHPWNEEHSHGRPRRANR